MAPRKRKRVRRDKDSNENNYPLTTTMDVREDLFVRYYTAYNSFTFKNGTKSAKEAYGLNDNSAGVKACRLLKKKHILAAIDERLNQIFFKIDLTPDRLISEMAALATANITDFYDDNGNLINPKKLPRHITAAIRQVDVETTMVDGQMVANVQKIYLHDKRAAGETLMKFKNMLYDRLVIEEAGRAPASQDDKAKATRQKMLEELRAEDEAQAAIDAAMEEE